LSLRSNVATRRNDIQQKKGGSSIWSLCKRGHRRVVLPSRRLAKPRRSPRCAFSSLPTFPLTLPGKLLEWMADGQPMAISNSGCQRSLQTSHHKLRKSACNRDFLELAPNETVSKGLPLFMAVATSLAQPNWRSAASCGSTTGRLLRRASQRIQDTIGRQANCLKCLGWRH
jgi:hypothetical protein